MSRCGKPIGYLPAGAVRDAVRGDALRMADALRRLCPHAPWLRLQLEIIGRDACWRWHQDHYCGRAIITYVGPGTWLAEDADVRYDQFAATEGLPHEASGPRIVPAA